ncbi:Fe-S protein assembly co-chaperone HscB [Ophiocordyceps camponoti-floridani]|uniref:Fe-S protein assembly co-chaperone HscB n=1 Tax=Ophiocordyceps camponoti-floridani TaxID=2030778 RepID=A0A8H4Q0Z7_9HYPO|nr:Fe-S protein assembly co-chaperone HscB [Ophiocordyceps camponoti-floridani]
MVLRFARFEWQPTILSFSSPPPTLPPLHDESTPIHDIVNLHHQTSTTLDRLSNDVIVFPRRLPRESQRIDPPTPPPTPPSSPPDRLRPIIVINAIIIVDAFISPIISLIIDPIITPLISLTPIPIPIPTPKYNLRTLPQIPPLRPPPSGPFQVNLPSLRREFLQLQSIHHPDKHPADEKVSAEATSALINHAYHILSDPLLRAQYLLKLRKIDVNGDRQKTIDDEPLWEVVMEAFEAVDAATTQADLDALRKLNETRISTCEHELDIAFAKDDMKAATHITIRLLFWDKIRAWIEEWKPPAETSTFSPIQP